MTEETLFELARKTPEAEWAALLDRACEGKPELRERVEALLKADAASSPLSKPSPLLEPTAGFSHASMQTTADQEGSIIDGRFKLLQKLGEGGMGTVWVAEQEQPVKRRVALKLVKAGMDSAQVIRRFEAERQALALMDHTNIAKVLDAGTTVSGRPYFVMELVKGVPITKYCDEVHASIKNRLELYVQVCSAVQHAHQKGIIHRDIKPSNVLVAMQDGKPVPKVIDFGVAKALHTKLADQTMYTEIGQIIGTLEYMSPEQAELSAMDIDTRADIYALGVLLYELLTGSTPITRERMKSEAFVEVIRLIKEEEPPRPSTRLSESKQTLASLAALRRTDPKKLSSTMRGELDWVVMKALEKDRTRRYETANGLARDIQRYLADEVVEARAPTAGYRLKKFVRRNVGKVIAASLVLGALLLGIVGTTWGLFRANAAAEGERLAKVAAEEQQRRAENGEKLAGERLVQVEAVKKKAIEFRDKALDALRAMTNEDVENLLAGKSELSSNDRAYLEAIAARWLTFAKSEGRDELSQSLQAEGTYRVANLWHRLGRNTDARPLYEQAISLREKMVSEYPGVRYYRYDLATSNNSMGILLQDLGEKTVARKYYEKTITLLEKLTAEFPTVLDYQSDLAGSLHNLGSMLSDLGEKSTAKEYFRKAIAIQEKLVAESPDVPQYREFLANHYHNLGNLLGGLGESKAAQEFYQKALALREKLVTEFPNRTKNREFLANNHHGLGRTLYDLSSPKEALEHFQKALAIREKLSTEFPAVLGYRQQLNSSYSNMGWLLGNLGEVSKAKEYCQKSIITLEKLVVEFPASSGYWIELGGNYCNLGSMVSKSGDPNNSLDLFGKAIATLRRIHEAEPHNVTANWNLIQSYFGRGMALEKLEKPAEAAKDWNSLITLTSGKEQKSILDLRVVAMAKVGDITHAIAEVVDMTQSNNWNAYNWYNFAWVYAVASGKDKTKQEEYASRAMELLQQSIKAGFKEIDFMKKDKGLEPLRGREDFKKLMADLEKLPQPTEKK